MKKLKNGKSLYCSAFIIAINDPEKKTDSLKLSQNEVQLYKWLPIEYFEEPNLTIKKSKHYFGPKFAAKYF